MGNSGGFGQHPCAPSVEHLTPQSQQGCDHLANLVPAHNWCNARRGDALSYDPALDPLHQEKVVRVLAESQS